MTGLELVRWLRPWLCRASTKENYRENITFFAWFASLNRRTQLTELRKFGRLMVVRELR